MKREEEIKAKGKRQRAKGKEQRVKSGVNLHQACNRVKLNSGVLSLGSGRSTNLPEAKYGLGADCITRSLQLSATMPTAKYHLGGDYPIVAHGVLSLGSGRSTNLPEAKYGSAADCIAVSRQLSNTMFDITMCLTVQYRLLAVRFAPVHVIDFAVDFSQRITNANTFGLQPHIFKMGLKPVSLFGISFRQLKQTAIEEENFNSFSNIPLFLLPPSGGWGLGQFIRPTGN